MTSFDDKVAIVTGTSLGVGIACDLTVAGASRRAGEPASRVAQMAISHPHGVNHELRALVDQLTMQLEGRVRSDASSWGCHRCR